MNIQINGITTQRQNLSFLQECLFYYNCDFLPPFRVMGFDNQSITSNGCRNEYQFMRINKKGITTLIILSKDCIDNFKIELFVLRKKAAGRMVGVKIIDIMVFIFEKTIGIYVISNFYHLTL